jgi:hypothetical protein
MALPFVEKIDSISDRHDKAMNGFDRARLPLSVKSIEEEEKGEGFASGGPKPHFHSN